MDGAPLMQFTSRRNLVIELLCRPGSFLLHNQAIAKCWVATGCNESVAADIHAALIIGTQRTPPAGCGIRDQ